MRLVRVIVLIAMLTLASSVLAQTSQVNSQSGSDPQAIAVVQAAITALGGATVIGQSDTWELEARLDGPIDSGVKTETINLHIPNATIAVSGVSKPSPKFVSPSVFLPALAAAVLLQESQDSSFIMRFDSPSTLGSKPVNIIKLISSSTQAIAQVWVFDAASGLPMRVIFDLPAEIGLTRTFGRMIDFSDWRVVSGVLYPFSVVIYVSGRLPETVELESVSASASTSSSTTSPITGGGQ